MRSEATFQMVAIAKRIAEKNGVSVSDVLDKFSQSVKKTAHTRSDFFWGDSDITRRQEKFSARSFVGRVGSPRQGCASFVRG